MSFMYGYGWAGNEALAALLELLSPDEREAHIKKLKEEDPQAFAEFEEDYKELFDKFNSFE